MKIKSALFIFSFLFLLTELIYAGDGKENVIYKSFDIRSESTRPKITKLYLDQQGQIWTGTDHGLFKFDGIDFVKIAGTDSLAFKNITSLFQSSDGTLWVGCSSGRILKVVRNHFTIFDPEGNLPKVPVTGFAEDKKKRIFFCTNGNGLYLIDREHLININEEHGLSDNYCYGLVSLDDGRIATGTDAGINLVNIRNNQTEVTIFDSGNELPDDIIRAIYPAGNGLLWIGMQDKGVLLYDYKSNKILNDLSGNWNNGPVTGMEMVDGNLWIATEDKGIFILYRDSSIVPYPLNLGRNYKPLGILRDLENNVWIAESIHLIRTAGNKIRLINEGGNFNFAFVHCILSTKDGSIYFSPDYDLVQGKKKKDGSREYEYYKLPGNKADIVTLYEDPAGYVWLGTMGNGVFRFNPKTKQFKQILASNSIESASILSITGRGNEIWIAGFNGANKFIIENLQSDNIRLLPEKEMNSIAKLNDDYVYSVFIDSKDRSWFATDEHGVYYIENKKLKNLAIPGNTVHSFAEDKSGRIWIGTAEAGILIYSEDTLIRLEPKDGLSSPSISSLFCTVLGNIVMVYDNGFDLINADDFSVNYHSTEEGLSDLNSNINAISGTKNGEIYIGTEKGIIEYHPSSDNQLKQPKIILTSVSVFLEDIDFNVNHKFDYDENNIRFDFTGLWYSDPKRVKYFYMLEGYSTKWQQTKDRYVIFPKLPPGKYTFRVKSTLNNPNTDLKDVSYSFVIKPPLWQSWWFRIIAAAILAFTIFLMILERDRRLRKRDREMKERIEFQFETLKSQVNPHFLFNSFNTLISVIEKQPQMAVEYVEKLSEFFRSIVNYRDKDLIPLNEELDLLENYIFIQKKRYGENLIVQNRINEEMARMLLVPPLVLQLLAENAIKHNAVSRETPLTLKLEVLHEKVCISNNLNPKITRESSSGLGLQNIISRYKLLTEDPVNVHRDEQNFSVQLPLIQKNNT